MRVTGEVLVELGAPAVERGVVADPAGFDVIATVGEVQTHEVVVVVEREQQRALGAVVDRIADAHGFIPSDAQRWALA